MSASPQHDPVCAWLPWDSHFFGIEIARVLGDTLTADRAARIDQWCRSQGTRLLYFLARSEDAATSRIAEEVGYREVDVRVTFERSLTGDVPVALPTAIGHFIAADLPALRQIARTSYTDSRFYHDGRIPRAKCDELFETWTAQACERHPDQVLVAREGGSVAGYVTSEFDAASLEATIVLIGVAEASRGRGIGGQLVQAAVTLGAARGATAISVVTQQRNAAARRLYQRFGFVTRSIQRYYHKWYD
jgi:GNAT superfamily N-acetyltransferase